MNTSATWLLLVSTIWNMKKKIKVPRNLKNSLTANPKRLLTIENKLRLAGGEVGGMIA